MVKKKRNRLTTEEKVIVLKEHFIGKKLVSDICEDNNIHPSQFYRWQSELLCNAVYAFDKGKDKESVKWQKKALELEQKLIRKNEVLSELMEEHIAF